MDILTFKASVDREEPPTNLSLELEALWHAAKGKWETAHKLAQGSKSVSGAWVHAYLHRVEGDLSNARYWYCKAGHPEASSSLQEEWRIIAETLL